MEYRTVVFQSIATQNRNEIFYSVEAKWQMLKKVLKEINKPEGQDYTWV